MSIFSEKLRRRIGIFPDDGTPRLEAFTARTGGRSARAEIQRILDEKSGNGRYVSPTANDIERVLADRKRAKHMFHPLLSLLFGAYAPQHARYLVPNGPVPRENIAVVGHYDEGVLGLSENYYPGYWDELHGRHWYVLLKKIK